MGLLHLLGGSAWIGCVAQQREAEIYKLSFMACTLSDESRRRSFSRLRALPLRGNATQRGFVYVEPRSDKNVQPTFHGLTTQLPPVRPTDASNDLFSRQEGVTLADISLRHAEGYGIYRLQAIRVRNLITHLSRCAGYESGILFCREGLSLCTVLCRDHNNHRSSTNARSRRHLDLPDVCEPGIYCHHAQLH